MLLDRFGVEDVTANTLRPRRIRGGICTFSNWWRRRAIAPLFSERIMAGYVRRDGLLEAAYAAPDPSWGIVGGRLGKVFLLTSRERRTRYTRYIPGIVLQRRG